MLRCPVRRIALFFIGTIVDTTSSTIAISKLAPVDFETHSRGVGAAVCRYSGESRRSAHLRSGSRLSVRDSGSSIREETGRFKATATPPLPGRVISPIATFQQCQTPSAVVVRNHWLLVKQVNQARRGGTGTFRSR